MTPRQSAIAVSLRRRPHWLRARLARSVALALLCVVGFSAAGCAKRKIAVFPLMFNPATTRAPEPMDPPEMATSLPEEAPPALVIPPPRPRRPVVRSAEVAATPAVEPEPPKPVPPRISLRMSPAQESDYRQRTNQAIAVAERNLQSVNGSNLSVAQQDLVEKIRGFLSQSREAVRTGDWLRAHSLATKAQVLSEELISLKS